MNDIIVIVPAFNPNEELMLEFIKTLSQEFKNIVVINDGSDKSHSDFFNKLSLNPQITLFTHYINLGKGQALKTAINATLVTFPNCSGIVTADCDGQHTVQAVKDCAVAALNHPDSLILGVRDFNKNNVPPKSKFGNKLTRTVFKLFIGLGITDTQTGLRAMSPRVATKFLSTNGSRYEYETNMLIDCKLKEINIVEVPIETIYIDSNSGSHFNPLKDSISIYKVFAKYIIAAISSFIIDIVLFTMFLKLLNLTYLPNIILLATIFARVISSLYNFLINAKLVFKKMNNKSLIKYIILVIIQMFVSGFIVSYICNSLSNSSATLIKILVDSVIFLVNFVVQREWIFKKK